jgi:N-acetyl-anhydromuramyl-L-alanine amidase AmpD/LysM repeat protein
MAGIESMELNIKDVRAKMPNYQNYKSWLREGEILGIAVHHSATADRATGAPAGNAHTFFNYHVNMRGWAHGGYNYVITGDGLIEYALDEKISAYHAGFKDPDNSEGLEHGQYWNNHYLAICLSGWFSENRTYRDADGRTQMIPNAYTNPTEAQMQSLLALIQYLRQKYGIPVENVRAHRELAGNSTVCPGHNLDPAQLRAKIRAADEAEAAPPPEPEPDGQPEVSPGEQVLLLPDTDKYLTAAMTYIWKFQPDVSFSIDEAQGRWQYVLVAGNKEDISDSQLDQLRSSGAALVQRVAGTPEVVQTTLDELVEAELRFLPTPSQPAPTPKPPPEETWRTYTIQPGDTLSLVARQMYGQAHLWRIIFEANRDILSDPGRIYPGQIIKIPPRPE